MLYNSGLETDPLFKMTEMNNKNYDKAQETLFS